MDSTDLIFEPRDELDYEDATALDAPTFDATAQRAESFEDSTALDASDFHHPEPTESDPPVERFSAAEITVPERGASLPTREQTNPYDTPSIDELRIATLQDKPTAEEDTERQSPDTVDLDDDDDVRVDAADTVDYAASEDTRPVVARPMIVEPTDDEPVGGGLTVGWGKLLAMMLLVVFAAALLTWTLLTSRLL